MDLIHIRDIVVIALQHSSNFTEEAQKSGREFVEMVDNVWEQGRLQGIAQMRRDMRG